LETPKPQKLKAKSHLCESAERAVFFPFKAEILIALVLLQHGDWTVFVLVPQIGAALISHYTEINLLCDFISGI